MSDVSGTLIGLIDVAERTLCCRQRTFPAAFDDFAAEVSALQPPVGVRMSMASGILVTVLPRFWESPEAQRPMWLMTIAALLQLVRDDLGQVIEARRRPIEPDTRQYSGARR